MCFQTNLRYLGKLKLNLRDRVPRVSLREQRFVERSIKKGIWNQCPDDLAQRAINGFYRSPTDPKSGEDDFLKTDQPYCDLPRDIHYRKALRVVEKIFRPKRRLKPIAFPDLRYFPWTLNTSAEYPYRESKTWQEYVRQKQRDGDIDDERLSFHNLYNEIFHENRHKVHQIKEGKRPFWDENGNPVPYGYTYLHSRAHMRIIGDDPKIRAVFGITKLLLMVENMFIWNLQREYLNHRNAQGPLLWGFETFRSGWQRLVGLLTRKQINSIISADWSGFDHKALHEVIDDVHDMWRSWFDFDQGYEPSVSNTHNYSSTKTNPKRIQRLWDWMCHSLKHTPIVAESGNLYQWLFNGIASGYQQTQLLDSFVNAIMLLTCLSACGINIEGKHFQALFQGDDSITTFPERIEFKSFMNNMSQEAKRRFNANLSPEKTTFGEWFEDIEVLSYKYKDGKAYRDPAELLAHLLYPERPRRANEAAAACIGIASAAMGCSQHVYNTCKDVYMFFVNELKIEPRFPETDLNDPGRWWIPKIRYFPSFEETFLQNYDARSREKSDRERLWPTEPTGNGFHFLVS